MSDPMPSNDLLKAEYLSGATGTELAKKYARDPNSIYRRLKLVGTTLRKPGPNPRSSEDIAAILALREDGATYQKIGDAFGISAVAAWKLVKRWGHAEPSESGDANNQVMAVDIQRPRYADR